MTDTPKQTAAKERADRVRYLAAKRADFRNQALLVGYAAVARSNWNVGGVPVTDVKGKVAIARDIADELEKHASFQDDRP